MDFTSPAIALVKHLDEFVCEVSSLDRIWNVLFPDRAGKWRHLHVLQYKDSHYLTRVGDEAKSLEVVRGRRVRVAEDMGGAACSWNGNAAEVDADLGRFKRRIAPFVTWEPLPIIRPRE